MKKLLCTVAMTTLTLSSFAQEQDMKLFILAGQSNMAGRGKVEEQDKSSNLQIFALNKELQWSYAVDPIHFDKKEAGVGPGKSFAIELLKTFPQWNIGLIPCAVGGSPIAAWRKGFFFKQTNSHPYDDLIARCKVAQQSGKLCALLWIQGESDANDESKAKTQKKLLTDLLKSIRQELDVPDLPIFIGEVPPIKRPALPIVIEAQKEVVKTLDNCFYVNTPENVIFNQDNLHMSSKSARDMGVKFAELYVEEYKKKEKSL